MRFRRERKEFKRERMSEDGGPVNGGVIGFCPVFGRFMMTERGERK